MVKNAPVGEIPFTLGTKEPFAVSHVSGADGSIGELKDVYFDEVTVGPYIMPKVAGAFSTLTSGMLGKEDIDGRADGKSFDYAEA